MLENLDPNPKVLVLVWSALSYYFIEKHLICKGNLESIISFHFIWSQNSSSSILNWPRNKIEYQISNHFHSSLIALVIFLDNKWDEVQCYLQLRRRVNNWIFNNWNLIIQLKINKGQWRRRWDFQIHNYRQRDEENKKTDREFKNIKIVYIRALCIQHKVW